MGRGLDGLPVEPAPTHPMAVQYDTRRDDQGWTVFDRWTGHVVVLQGADQSGLDWMDANDLVERLNRRHLEGDRSILQ